MTKKKRPNLKRKSRFSKIHLTFYVAVFALVGAVALFTSLAAGRGGSNVAVLSSLGTSFKDLQYPVEQESPNFFNCGGSAGPYPDCPFDQSTWVRNPTTCIWDVDDMIQDYGKGVFQAGSTVTDTKCAIPDGTPGFGYRHIDATMYAPTPNLILTFSNDKGMNKTVTPTQTGKNSYKYVYCVYDTTPGPFPTIDNSNGGYGLTVNYTVTAKNPTSHNYKDVTLLLTLGAPRGGVVDPGCDTVVPSL